MCVCVCVCGWGVQDIFFDMSTFPITVTVNVHFLLCDVGSTYLSGVVMQNASGITCALFMYLAVCVAELQVFSCGRVSTSV